MNIIDFTQGRAALAMVILALLSAVAGCAESGPKVYTTKGKVAFKGTGETATQLQGCYIYLEQVEDPKITAVSEIDRSWSMLKSGAFLPAMTAANSRKSRICNVCAGSSSVCQSAAPVR